MNEKDSIALARLGVRAWNEWANAASQEAGQNRNDAHFEEVDFSSPENSDIDFHGYRFPGRAFFYRAKFGENINFIQTQFDDVALFDDSVFHEGVQFGSSKFASTLAFEGVEVRGMAAFPFCQFARKAIFYRARFMGNAHFESSRFEDGATFNYAHFREAASFRKANFEGGSEFSETRFYGPSDFSDTEIKRTLLLRRTRFDHPPQFLGASDTKHVVLDRVRVTLDSNSSRSVSGRVLGLLTGAKTDDVTVPVLLRTLRGIADDTNAVDDERRLFVLERQAELNVLWRDWLSGSIKEPWRTLRPLQNWSCWLPYLLNIFREAAHPFRNTILMTAYRLFSACGQSVILPTAWLVSSVVVCREIYEREYVARKALSCIDDETGRWLLEFAIGNVVPFATTTRLSYRSAVEQLFSMENEAIAIPISIQLIAAAQGIFSLLMVFLIGLAVRNYFRVG